MFLNFVFFITVICCVAERNILQLIFGRIYQMCVNTAKVFGQHIFVFSFRLPIFSRQVICCEQKQKEIY